MKTKICLSDTHRQGKILIRSKCIECGFCLRKKTINERAKENTILTGNEVLDRITAKCEIAKATIEYERPYKISQSNINALLNRAKRAFPGSSIHKLIDSDGNQIPLAESITEQENDLIFWFNTDDHSTHMVTMPKTVRR